MSSMNKSRNLVVIKGDFSISDYPGDQEIISFETFKNWIRSLSFFLHLFSYKSASLQIYRNEYLNYPLLIFLLLRLISRRCPFIVDAEGKKQYITMRALAHAFHCFIRDWLDKATVIRQIDNRLSEGWGKPPIIDKKAPTSITENPLLYLRTDLWFGVVAGGSVGHIAGVLNEFHRCAGNTIFLSTDRIPTVKSDIAFHLLRPTDRYWDFPEFPSLASNACFESQAIDVIGDLIPSIIYQRYSLNNFTGISLARRYQAPFVLEYNGSEVWMARHWAHPLKYETLSERIELFNLKMADIVVVVSQPSKDDLIAGGIEADKILVNPNGVDTDRYFPGIDGSRIRKQYGLESKLIIGFMGTFGRWHGAEVLAEAFGRLLKAYPDLREHITLMMIGDGLKMSEVKENLEKLGVRDQSILTGFVPQTQGAEYLAACDILVSPHIPNRDGTPFFGSPTKIFEYMAMGKGIVASDLDQIGEVFEHGRTAWLVQPGNVSELTIGLKKLIDDPTLRRRLGEAARQEVLAKYTWKEHVRRIIEKVEERCR